jgi:hypothetical protein
MPAPLRLGFLTHLHGAAEPRKLYRDYAELFVAAEEPGGTAPRRDDHHAWAAGHAVASALAWKSAAIDVGVRSS